ARHRLSACDLTQYVRTHARAVPLPPSVRRRHRGGGAHRGRQHVRPAPLPARLLLLTHAERAALHHRPRRQTFHCRDDDLTYSTRHHGAASTSGAIQSSRSPSCNNSPRRARSPYSARNDRSPAMSLSRGREVALISIGSSRPPDSITRSTSSPEVVRQ